MAIRLPTVLQGLTRAGSYLNPSQDWTRAVWIKYPPADGTYTTGWSYILDPVNYIGTFQYGAPFDFQDFEGVTDDGGLSVNGPLSLDWQFLVLRHRASTQRVDLLINAVPVGSTPATVLANVLSGVADFLGTYNGIEASAPGGAFAYDRVWQSALSDNAIALEMRSETAVQTTGLLRDEALATADDLGSWTALGLVETVPGPLTGPSDYQTTTLADAIILLGDRLMDPEHARWTSAELTLHIQEALRTWNALTAFFRASGSVLTTASQAFYDLPTILPAIRGFTFTTQRAIDLVCYALQEPVPTGNVWNGTKQFTLGQVTAAIQEARDKFLLETAAVVTHREQAVDPVPVTGRVAVSEDIANIRRVAWKTANGYVTILRRDDEWSLTYYARQNWQTPANRYPSVYAVGQTAPLVMQIGYVPTTPGTLDLLTIDRGADLTPAVAQVLGVPDDWAWVVVFGALGVLLSRDGLARDPARAAYCNSRYDDGITRAKAAAVVLDGTIQNASVGIASVSDADAFSPSWQMVPGVPKRLLTAGQTILGIWPPPGVPTTGVGYGITLDVVRNAPVPVSGADYLQVGPELLETILDYAQYQALFKEGAAAIQGAQPLIDRFFAMADTEVAIQWGSSPNRQAALAQTTKDVRVVPYDTSNKGTIN